MAELRRPPVFRHVFRLASGDVLLVPQRDARRVVDRRSERSQPETCWEVRLPSGLVRQLWPDEILAWTVEELT